MSVEQSRSLLPVVEEMLQGSEHITRLFFGFTLADDKKIQQAINEDFSAWRSSLEGSAGKLTGMLLMYGQVALHLLEGPTDLVFSALQRMSQMAAEVKGEESPTAGDRASEKSRKAPLISQLRVLYQSELHSVRVSRSWCCVALQPKLVGGQSQLEEGSCPDITLGIYKKMLLACLKVTEQTDDKATTPRLINFYNQASALLPSADEAFTLNGKGGADFFFSYEEFEKVYIAPFNLVLHSELLWPMPPPLSY